MQTTGDVLLTIGIIGGLSLLFSIFCTGFLFAKRRISSTAWIYSLLSIISFAIAGNLAIAYATIVTIIIINWNTPLGLIGGYLLLILGFNQYFKENKEKSNLVDSAEIHEKEESTA